MANEKVNKVILGDETLIDLTPDTVTASTLALGETAHDASGEQITGTMVSGASKLSELNDVNLTSLSHGQIIKYNSTDDEWQNADNTLANLDDITISSPSNGQILKRQSNKWINGTLGLNDLSNVTISSASTGQVLQYTGSVWQNRSLPSMSQARRIYLHLRGLDLQRYSVYINAVSDSLQETLQFTVATQEDIPSKTGTYIGQYYYVDVNNLARNLFQAYWRIEFTIIDTTVLEPLPIILPIFLPYADLSSPVVEFEITFNGTSGTLTGMNLFYESVLGNSENAISANAVNNAINALKISDLADTNISNISDGQALVYDGTSQKWVNGEGSKDKYSNTVSCSVGDTEAVFTDVTYSNTATYEVFGDDGTGLGVPIAQIWYDSNNKVKATFVRPLTNATTCYLKYWER